MRLQGILPHQGRLCRALLLQVFPMWSLVADVLVLRIWFGLLQGRVSQPLVKESDRLDLSWVLGPAVELNI